MTVLRLARSELKRMTGGLLPKLTILALTMVPLLYGAVYLYANWDPYGKLNQIDAALVVEDTGATSADGTRLEAGRKVADSLVDAHIFNWQTVPDTAEADEGVSTGKYAFALKIPEDFSANLVSPGSFDAANQAMLNVTTNDANNYLLSTIVDKLTTAVHTTVATEVGEETANQLLTGFGTIHSQMLKASDGAGQLADGVASLHDGTVTLHQGTGELKNGAADLYNGQVKLRDGATSLSTGAAKLGGGLAQLENKTATLPADSQTLADGAAQVAAGNAALNTKVQALAGQVTAAEQASAQAAAQARRGLVIASNNRLVAAGTITPAQADAILADFDTNAAPPAAAGPAATTGPAAALKSAAGQIQQLADGSAAVSAGAAKLAGATPALTAAIAQASTGADQLSTGAATLAAGQQSALDGAGKLSAGAEKLDDGAARLESGAATAADGAGTLAAELAKGTGQVPNPDDTQKDSIAKVIADPVAVSNVSQAKAGSYGAGLAPFFLTLALWIGIFMLVQAMRPITQRALTSNAPAWKIAVGGWLPFLAVSAAQASLLTLVVDVGLGLNPAHPWLMWFLMLAAAMAFSAIIQGVVALFGTPGKLVVLILLVLQLVSSGGTFPWQTTPEPLHVVHQILPMGYVVNGMRHLIYGADLAVILPTMLGLLGYTLVGTAMSTLAVRKHKFWTLKSLKPEIAV